MNESLSPPPLGMAQFLVLLKFLAISRCKFQGCLGIICGLILHSAICSRNVRRVLHANRGEAQLRYGSYTSSHCRSAEDGEMMGNRAGGNLFPASDHFGYRDATLEFLGFSQHHHLLDVIRSQELALIWQHHGSQRGCRVGRADVVGIFLRECFSCCSLGLVIDLNGETFDRRRR